MSHIIDIISFMDATYEIYSKPVEEGREKYGNNFKNSDYLLGWHHFSAAQQDADHLHGGNGFLMQHVKVTNIFEKALQVCCSFLSPSLMLL